MSFIIPIKAANTPQSPSETVARKRVSALRRDRSVIASTMRCARVSSQLWSANFSHTAVSRRSPRREWPCSNSSKAGIIPEDATPVWTIAPPWNTKDGTHRLHDYESPEPSTKPGPLQTKCYTTLRFRSPRASSGRGRLFPASRAANITPPSWRHDICWWRCPIRVSYPTLPGRPRPPAFGFT